MEQKGQVVVLLLLVMVVALAIGLSTIGRSTVEVSTSRKSEDSSRAFSAAEAGIERAMKANLNNLGKDPIPVPSLNLGNQASANVAVTAEGIPYPGIALSLPPINKNSFAQFWLANPTQAGFNDVPVSSYTANSYKIYFGDPKIDYSKSSLNQEMPAIEVHTIYWDGAKYVSSANYFDSYISGPRSSGFIDCRSDAYCSCSSLGSNAIPVNDGKQVDFYCQATINNYPPPTPLSNPVAYPVMVRVRFLYTNLPHPVAILPASGSNIPKQALIYMSSGISGEVKRTLKVFQQKDVMPEMFDYVLFSADKNFGIFK